MLRIFVAMAIALLVSTTTVGAEEVIVSGYSAGEYAVKGEVEKRLAELVVKLKKQETGNLEISVIGSADKTGKSDANDELAEKRATQVVNMLQSQFPEAKVTAWSGGDGADVRQVKVRYKFTPSATASTVSTDPSKINLLFALAVFVSVIFLFYLLITKVLKQKPRFNAPAVKATLESKYVVINGFKIRIDCMEDGKWLSPFKTETGVLIIRKDLRDLEKSLMGCMTKAAFRGQVEKLKAAGVIIPA